METDHHSDKSTDEPNAKRANMETEAPTSSKPESINYFLSLPLDVLSNIIATYIPVNQWPALESLDKHFRDATTLIVWRQIRNINVKREFLINARSSVQGTATPIESILQKFAERSPFVTSLTGITLRYYPANSNSDVIHSLVQFEYLQSITVSGAKLFEGRRGSPLEDIVEFLETTQSRTSLKEIRLYDVVQHYDVRAMILARFALSFVSGLEFQSSSLILEKFSFTSSDPSLDMRFDTMDTTQMIDLRLGQARIDPDHLAGLIQRAPNLQRIELSFMHCHEPCNGPRLQANKRLLTTLASHQNLTAIRFDSLAEGCEDMECTDFDDEFMDMLETIGHRGRLTELAFEEEFVCPNSIDISLDRIFDTICDHLPCLQSIKLFGIHGDFSKIVQLPQLERLALRISSIERIAFANSLKCLANLATLTDLRIGYCRWISTSVYEKWSEGLFAPNLEILMLSDFATKDINDDEELGLIRLLKKAVRLRVLILHGIISDRLLTAIAKWCPNLEILGVESSVQLKCRPFQKIVDRCPKLKRLDGLKNKIRKKLIIPKYRIISDVDVEFRWRGFDDDEYV